MAESPSPESIQVPQEDPLDRMSSEDDDESTEDVDVTTAEEFSSSQEELRAGKQLGLGLSYGATAPWYALGLWGQYVRSPSLLYMFGIGSMKYKFTGTHELRSYTTTGKVQTAVAGGHYYPTDRLPFFLSGYVGYHFWSGDVEAFGVDITNSKTAELATGYSAHGPSVGAGCGFSYLWAKGWYVEYALIGFGRSWVLSKALTQDDASAVPIVVRDIAKAYSWGFTNLSVGYFF